MPLTPDSGSHINKPERAAFSSGGRKHRMPTRGEVFCEVFANTAYTCLRQEVADKHYGTFSCARFEITTKSLELKLIEFSMIRI